MTAWTALLSLYDIDLETIGVYVAMVQCAAPSGAIRDDEDELRRHYYRVFGKRLTTDRLRERQDELMGREAIPSREATYPLANPGEKDERIDQIVEQLKSDVSGVHPDFDEFPDDERIFGAFKAAKVMEIAAKESRETLSVGDSAIVNAGHQVRYWVKEWDYGFVGKLKAQHGTESIIDTVAEIRMHRGFEPFRKGTWKQRRKKFRQYLLGALSGDVDPKTETDATVVY
jgi:hypothetical protein